jgi:hypothetical protein
MMGRKGVLFIGNDEASKKARDMLTEAGIEFVEYNVDVEPEGCCGGFKTAVPSLFAPEGIFRGLDGIARYIELRKSNRLYSSESAYW